MTDDNDQGNISITSGFRERIKSSAKSVNRIVNRFSEKEEVLVSRAVTVAERCVIGQFHKSVWKKIYWIDQNGKD